MNYTLIAARSCTFNFDARFDAPEGLGNFDLHHERLDDEPLGYSANVPPGLCEGLHGDFLFADKANLPKWFTDGEHSGVIDEDKMPYGGFIPSVVQESLSFILDKDCFARLRLLLEQDLRFCLPLRFTPRGEFTQVDTEFAPLTVSARSLREMVRQARVGFIGRHSDGRVLSNGDWQDVVYGTAAALHSSWIYRVGTEECGKVAIEPITYRDYGRLHCPWCDTVSLHRLQEISRYASWADKQQRLETAGVM